MCLYIKGAGPFCLNNTLSAWLKPGLPPNAQDAISHHYSSTEAGSALSSPPASPPPVLPRTDIQLD